MLGQQTYLISNSAGGSFKLPDIISVACHVTWNILTTERQTHASLSSTSTDLPCCNLRNFELNSTGRNTNRSNHHSSSRSHTQSSGIQL